MSYFWKHNSRERDIFLTEFFKHFNEGNTTKEEVIKDLYSVH